MMLEMFPKEAYTGDWMVAFRVVIPLYMVMALSQFITYLLILIVGEKENKIKEGMKIMGLKDSVFWLVVVKIFIHIFVFKFIEDTFLLFCFRLSWFIIYGLFVLFLSVVCCVLLFTLRVFQNTNFLVIFILVLLYSLSIIMFGFMLTPFFDKARVSINCKWMLYLTDLWVRYRFIRTQSFITFLNKFFESYRVVNKYFRIIPWYVFV